MGGDIIFDLEKSISFEGDSGPYLQYAHTRAHSILEKAHIEGVTESLVTQSPNPKISEVSEVEKLLYRFPEIVELSLAEYAPQYIATYLIELSASFNAYYANNKIISDDVEAPYRVALTQAVRIVLLKGLQLLGISVPEKM